MSNQEAVTAYVEGRISRRSLIRSLVAAGVSTGAAVSYAHLLDPERAAAGDGGFDDTNPQCGDEYPSVDMAILDGKLDRVVRREELRLRIRLQFGGSSGTPEAEILLTASTRRDGARRTLGERRVRLVAGETREVEIPLDNLRPLRGRRQAVLQVKAERTDSSVFCRPPSAPQPNQIRVRRTLS